MSMRKLSSLIAGLALLGAGQVFAGDPQNVDPAPSENAAPQALNAEVQRDFAKLDVDSNGSLSPEEAGTDLLLRSEFNSFDINGDQWLSKVEYRDFRMAQLDPDMDDEEEAE